MVNVIANSKTKGSSVARWNFENAILVAEDVILRKNFTLDVYQNKNVGCAHRGSHLLPLNRIFTEYNIL